MCISCCVSCSIDFDVMSIWTLNARTCILHTYMQVSLRSFLAACVNRHCTSSLECHCRTCRCYSARHSAGDIEYPVRIQGTTYVNGLPVCRVQAALTRHQTASQLHHQGCWAFREASPCNPQVHLPAPACVVLSVRFKLIVCKRTCSVFKVDV